jgi:hypothetical protein
VRDISPELPIRLAGYAARKRPADKADHPLYAQAFALKNPSGQRVVIVSVDNCEVSGAFMQPVLRKLNDEFGLERGAVILVATHTHSAPVLADTLLGMPLAPDSDQQAILKYSGFLQGKIIEAVSAALTNFKPASLEIGSGRASFAMNRRVYRNGRVEFGDNPDGPVDWDVPVMRVKNADGTTRAVLFGYACHATSVRDGDDWYVVSGEYPAYARQHLEACDPGAIAMFLTGMGADSDPAPRGKLIHAKRHGLELAGAVMGVLDRPMQPVSGSFKFAYDEIDIPLAAPPDRAQIEKDAQGSSEDVAARAKLYLNLLRDNKPLPASIRLPVSALHFGENLTMLFMAGEVVVDYSRRLKRTFPGAHLWTVGYAYETPCYVPSARILKEGGYEAESSLIYYGFYGPLKPETEDILIQRVSATITGLSAR